VRVLTSPRIKAENLSLNGCGTSLSDPSKGDLPSAPRPCQECRWSEITPVGEATLDEVERNHV
jgi:hypothetical protein